MTCRSCPAASTRRLPPIRPRSWCAATHFRLSGVYTATLSGAVSAGSNSGGGTGQGHKFEHSDNLVRAEARASDLRQRLSSSGPCARYAPGKPAPTGKGAAQPIREIHTSSSPATHRAQTCSSISTLCPAQAAISVGGTPEFSRLQARRKAPAGVRMSPLRRRVVRSAGSQPRADEHLAGKCRYRRGFTFGFPPWASASRLGTGLGPGVGQAMNGMSSAGMVTKGRIMSRSSCSRMWQWYM